ncbi:MAG: hypothetical protein JST04_06560 [Bdellovibrionales bacterium]|nr:hypothetical protein [Bdellovibrionales bacterium]
MSSFMDPKSNPNALRQPAGTDAANAKDAPIKVDGFGQVIALLEVADASFRESLLDRIAAKDPHLARQIRATLARN